MDNNIGFIYCTCDKYDDIWGLFFNRLYKYWPEMDLPVYICTESKSFNYDGYNISAPLSGINKDYSSWSRRLMDLLKYTKEDYVLFMLDDFVLTQPVNHSVVEKCYNFMKNDLKVGFVCLHQELTIFSNEERKSHAAPAEIPELHSCIKGMPYRITTQAGIWRKSYLLKLLRAHESAWQFEVRSNIRANIFYDTVKIYDVNEPIVEYPPGGIIWRGQFNEKYVSLFNQEEISQIIKKRGFFNTDKSKSTARLKHGLKDVLNYIRSFLPNT